MNKPNNNTEEITLQDCYEALVQQQETQIKHLKIQAKLIYSLYLNASGEAAIPGVNEWIDYDPKLDSRYS